MYEKSLDFYTEYKSRHGIVKIKKFTIEEYLEFTMVYNAYLKSIEYIDTLRQNRWHNRKKIRQIKKDIQDKLNALIDIVLIKKVYKANVLTKKEKQAIINIANKYNELENKKTSKKEVVNPNWLQSLIVYFAREFGYNKSETMGLNMCELDLLIVENEKFKNEKFKKEKCKEKILLAQLKAPIDVMTANPTKDIFSKIDKYCNDVMKGIDKGNIEKEKGVLLENNPIELEKLNSIRNGQGR